MKKIAKITFFIFTSIVVLPVLSLFFNNQKEDSVVLINSASADVPAVVVAPEPPVYTDPSPYYSGDGSGSGACDSGGGSDGSGCDGSW